MRKWEYSAVSWHPGQQSRRSCRLLRTLSPNFLHNKINWENIAWINTGWLLYYYSGNWYQLALRSQGLYSFHYLVWHRETPRILKLDSLMTHLPFGETHITTDSPGSEALIPEQSCCVRWAPARRLQRRQGLQRRSLQHQRAESIDNTA